MIPLPAHIGRYELERYLGGGGMAHVYIARDTILGRSVAVKILVASTVTDPESLTRFLREARACANLNHENVIQVYDFGQDETGRPYIVMEFLKGRDLAMAIREARVGDLRRKLRVACDVASALEYIHANGVVHRDIKPENIYITETGSVKLMDFGIAQAGASRITQPGMCIGTPAYMAPEQIRGESTDELVDVYAFGLVLYEMFTGSRAFRKDTVEQVFYAAINEPLNEELLRATGIPPALTALVMRCAAKNPTARPRSFTAIRNELAELVDRVERHHSAPLSAAAVVKGTSRTGNALAPSVELTRTARSRWSARNNKMAVIGAAGVIAGLALAVGWVTLARNSDSTKIEGPTSPSGRISTPTGDMVLVPAGTFLFGPEREQRSLPAFYIDRTEVTNATYATFAQATGRSLPQGFDGAAPDRPVSNISFQNAAEFATWANKRLPSFEEWEKAARGSDGRQYPWGNIAETSRAVTKESGLSGPMPADSTPEGASPFGALHMAGNVWEWVNQSAEPSPKDFEDFSDRLTPRLRQGEKWVRIRGGSWSEPLSDKVLYDSALVPARYHHTTIGFRCVRGVQ